MVVLGVTLSIHVVKAYLEEELEGSGGGEEEPEGSGGGEEEPEGSGGGEEEPEGSGGGEEEPEGSGGGEGGGGSGPRGPAAERGRLYKVLKTYYSGAFTTTANMVAKYGCGAVKSSSEEYRRVCGPWRANPLEQAPRRVMVRRDVPRVGLRGWRRKCCRT